MIDDRIVLQMARTYGMNPDKARKLLEDARSEPAIVKLIRKYEQLVGGDTDGQDSAGTVHRCMCVDQRDRRGYPKTEKEKRDCSGFS